MFRVFFFSTIVEIKPQKIMEKPILFVGIHLLFAQCQPAALPQANTATGVPNQEFKIALNQTVTLLENSRNRNTNLGKIKLVKLEDSRCPAQTTCFRQGAAIISLEIETPIPETQTVRLFIGDFMPNNSRNKRNISADTLLVALKDNVQYRLILKDVLPYPGTSDEAPQAVLLIKRP